MLLNLSLRLELKNSTSSLRRFPKGSSDEPKTFQNGFVGLFRELYKYLNMVKRKQSDLFNELQ